MVLCDTACFKYCKQNKMTFFQILTIISIPGKKNTVKEWSLTLYPEEPWFHRVFIVFCPGCYPLHWLLPTMRGCIHKPRLRSSLSLSCRVLYTETDRYLTSWEFHIALSWDRPPRVLMFRLKPPPPFISSPNGCSLGWEFGMPHCGIRFRTGLAPMCFSHSKCKPFKMTVESQLI